MNSGVFRLLAILGLHSVFLLSFLPDATADSGPDLKSRQVLSANQHYDMGLSDLLDENGYIKLPEDFSGSIDPEGFKMLSVDGKRPRFVKSGGSGNSAWSEGEFGVAGCHLAGGDRSILALALVGGELFIGGQFDRCNLTEVSNIARFDPAMNSFSALGSGVNDWVYDFAVDGTDLYVGGSFTQAGGNAVNGVAKFDTTQTGDQAWSALGAGVTFGGSPGTVRALEVVGGGLFAGGFFDEANGSPALNIARFDLAQSAWTAVGSGVNSLGVYAFASSGNALFVGGAFSSAGGKAASRVAKYDVAQSGNTGWSTLGSGVYRTINPVAAIVNALTMIGTDLYVGGTFTEAGNALTVNGLAKFDTGATGNAGWAELDSGLGLDGAKGVASLTAIGTYLYIGGAFDTAGGTPADNIVRFDTTKTDSFIWLEVGLGVDSTVAALAVSGSELYVGGAFSSAGARGMNGVARFDTNQVISDTPNDGWSSLGGGVSSTIWAMTAIGTDIYVGGQFNQVGNISASRIAKFDTTKKGDQGWSALGDGANGTVRALTSVGTDLYVGGSFTEVGNGLSANRIAKFDTTQNSNAGWSALGEGLNGGVLALASIGADLYVGGSFTGVVNGIVARRVAKFDSTQHGNAAWSALGDGVTGSAVHSMVAIGTDLYVGGQFTEAGDKTAANIAKFDSTQSNNSGWSPLSSGVDGFGVRALTAVGTDLYVGGGFSNAGGVSASGIAKFDATTLTWSELGGGVSGAATTSSVGTMATIGTDLYVGGDFQEAGGQPAPHVAVYDTRSDDKSGWSALGDGANNDVRAMAPIGNALYVGGQFTEAGGKFNYFFARHEVEDHIFQDRFQQQP